VTPIPLVNGTPVPFRLWTDEENAKIRKDQNAFLARWYEDYNQSPGMLPNTARQYHVEILTPVAPGDDLTFDHHPPEYDQLWMRFPLVDGGPETNKGNMVVSGRNPAWDLLDPVK
jgi:hypothetical protein